MKKNVLGLLFLCFMMSVMAQDVETEEEIIEAFFKVERSEVVNKIVNPRAENEATFLKIYTEYETARVELSKSEYALLSDYVKEWDGMTSAEIEGLMTRILEVSAKREELMRTYYAKLKEQTEVKLATQFYQAERYLWIVFVNQIYENNLFLGEGEDKNISKKKKKH